MSERNERHPDSERVEILPGTGRVRVFTPCHGAPVQFPRQRAVPGAKLGVVCPDSGEGWMLELAADETTASGLRPLWAGTDGDEGSR